MNDLSGCMESTEQLGAGSGGSPSEIYLLHMLRLITKFFEAAISLNSEQIEGGIAALVASIPDENVRTSLWAEYVKNRDELRYSGNGSTLSAAVVTLGKISSWLAENLEIVRYANAAML